MTGGFKSFMKVIPECHQDACNPIDKTSICAVQ